MKTSKSESNPQSLGYIWRYREPDYPIPVFFHKCNSTNFNCLKLQLIYTRTRARILEARTSHQFPSTFSNISPSGCSQWIVLFSLNFDEGRRAQNKDEPMGSTRGFPKEVQPQFDGTELDCLTLYICIVLKNLKI